MMRRLPDRTSPSAAHQRRPDKTSFHAKPAHAGQVCDDCNENGKQLSQIAEQRGAASLRSAWFAWDVGFRKPLINLDLPYDLSSPHTDERPS
jgi:hypothetical protein